MKFYGRRLSTDKHRSCTDRIICVHLWKNFFLIFVAKMLFSPRTTRWLRLTMVFCAFSLPPALSQRQNSPPKPKPHSPTQAPPDARYVGTKECALCHQA